MAQEAAVVVQQEVAVVPVDAAEDKQRLTPLRNHLKSQVSFIKAALELTSEQQEKLATFNEEWMVAEYRQAGKNKAKPQNLGNALVQVFGGGAVVRPQIEGNEDPLLKTTKSNIDKKINEILTAEQSEQLKQERLARDDFQAQALAELTVVLLERQIHLSNEQAQKLVPALTGKINKSCGWYVYLNNPQYIPTIPKAALSSVLTNDHLQFIGNLNQQDFLGNNFGLEQMFGLAEDPLQ
jgi:hypothetical protein